MSEPIDLSELERCTLCDGSGEVEGPCATNGTKMYRCGNCEGIGRIPFADHGIVALDGYSDDVHGLWIGHKRIEGYSPYLVEITTPSGDKLTATMDFDRYGWTCHIEAPEGSSIVVTEREGT